MIFAYSLNILGLILDFVGTFKLFFIRDKLFGPITYERVKTKLLTIPDENETVISTILAEGSAYKDPDYKDLFNRLNNKIMAIEEDNIQKAKLSERWLICIISGFALSLLSVVLQLVCFLSH